MLVVATWNLENLFRPDGDFGPTDAQAYDAKLSGLAELINHLDPDVLAVQEVGDRDALLDLTERLQGDWHVETSTVLEARHPIRVGVLSRLAISEVEQIAQFPDQLAPVQVDDAGATITAMGRGALHVRVHVDSTTVDIVTCHLKSKLLTFPGGRFQPHDEGERARVAAYALDRRAAEAVTVRAAANDLLAGHGSERAVVVLGDPNDEPVAATTQILLGPPGSEIGTAGFDRPDQGDAWRLWNLAALIPEERRISRVFGGRPEIIDHILVSHALVGRVGQVGTGDVQLTTGPAVGLGPKELASVDGARRRARRACPGWVSSGQAVPLGAGADQAKLANSVERAYGFGMDDVVRVFVEALIKLDAALDESGIPTTDGDGRLLTRQERAELAVARIDAGRL